MPIVLHPKCTKRLSCDLQDSNTDVSADQLMCVRTVQSSEIRGDAYLPFEFVSHSLNHRFAWVVAWNHIIIIITMSLLGSPECDMPDVLLDMLIAWGAGAGAIEGDAVMFMLPMSWPIIEWSMLMSILHVSVSFGEIFALLPHCPLSNSNV